MSEVARSGREDSGLPVRSAAIDIGTNTVLLTIADIHPKSSRPQGNSAERLRRPHLQVHAEHYRITRLGQGLQRSRRLSSHAIDRTYRCLDDFRRICDLEAIAHLRVVGTSALRDAVGKAAFLRGAHEILGVPVEVISGQREAELTFSGALSGLDECDLEGNADSGLLVFDIGGGSTEVVRGNACGRIDFAQSLDIGSVRLAERHPSDLPAAKQSIDLALGTIRTEDIGPCSGKLAIGLAGTVTTMWAVVRGVETYDFRKMQGARLSLEEVRDVTSQLARLSADEIRGLSGMEPGRADVIPYGALICERFMSRVGLADIMVSDRGVRHGLLAEIPPPVTG